MLTMDEYALHGPGYGPKWESRDASLELPWPGQVRENDTKNIEREEMRVIEW